MAFAPPLGWAVSAFYFGVKAIGDGGSSYNKPITAHDRICFVGGTLVKAESGWVKIDSLKINQVVYSYNFEIMKEELQPVLYTNKSLSDSVITLVIDGNTIKCTHEHPFYVVDRGWVPAKELNRGDFIKGFSGMVQVDDVILEYETDYVYNIQIRNNSNYYVLKSVDGILVHNSSYILDIDE